MHDANTSPDDTMTQPHPGALPLTRTILRVLLVLNVVAGTLILILLVTSLLAEAYLAQALGVRHGPGETGIIRGMQAIMLVGIIAVPITQLILRRLLEMVDTVRSGDPFLMINAVRLRTIAWALLG